MSKTRKVPSLILLAAASIALMFGVVGCGKNDTQQTSAQNQPAQTDQSQDPAAAANLAPTDATQATGTNQQQPASPADLPTACEPACAAACAVGSELSTACCRAGPELFQ